MKSDLALLKYTEDKVNLGLLFQINQIQHNDQREERQKLDHIFTLKVALDTKNQEVFSHVLRAGTQFFGDNVVEEFLNLMNVDYDP